jgi:hypothetical protein
MDNKKDKYGEVIDIQSLSMDIAYKIKKHFVKLALEDEFPADLTEGKLYDEITEIIYRKLS